MIVPNVFLSHNNLILVEGSVDTSRTSMRLIALASPTNVFCVLAHLVVEESSVANLVLASFGPGNCYFICHDVGAGPAGTGLE